MGIAVATNCPAIGKRVATFWDGEKIGEKARAELRNGSREKALTAILRRKIQRKIKSTGRGRIGGERQVIKWDGGGRGGMGNSMGGKEIRTNKHPRGQASEKGKKRLVSHSSKGSKGGDQDRSRAQKGERAGKLTNNRMLRSKEREARRRQICTGRRIDEKDGLLN